MEWDEERYCDAVYLGQILRNPSSSSPPELRLFITHLNCETALIDSTTLTHETAPGRWGQGKRAVCMETL